MSRFGSRHQMADWRSIGTSADSPACASAATASTSLRKRSHLSPRTLTASKNSFAGGTAPVLSIENRKWCSSRPSCTSGRSLSSRSCSRIWRSRRASATTARVSCRPSGRRVRCSASTPGGKAFTRRSASSPQTPSSGSVIVGIKR